MARDIVVLACADVLGSKLIGQKLAEQAYHRTLKLTEFQGGTIVNSGDWAFFGP